MSDWAGPPRGGPRGVGALSEAATAASRESSSALLAGDRTGGTLRSGPRSSVDRAAVSSTACASLVLPLRSLRWPRGGLIAGLGEDRESHLGQRRSARRRRAELGGTAGHRRACRPTECL